MKVTITKTYQSSTDKQGNALKTKDGRPYTRLAIQTQEHGTSWLSGFTSTWNAHWKEGDTVNVEVKKVEKDGKTYLNFERLDPIIELETRVKLLEDAIFNKQAETIPENDPTIDDIPF